MPQRPQPKQEPTRQGSYRGTGQSYRGNGQGDGQRGDGQRRDGQGRVDTRGLNLRRYQRVSADDDMPLTAEPPAISSAVGQVIDLTFNASRDKIREVTIIDRMQGKLFPILDMMNSLYRNCIEVATYRMSKEMYLKLYKKIHPEPIDVLDELMYRTAQWQKSVAGKNLEKATDIALAEIETRSDAGEEPISQGRGYEE